MFLCSSHFLSLLLQDDRGWWRYRPTKVFRPKVRFSLLTIPQPNFTSRGKKKLKKPLLPFFFFSLSGQWMIITYVLRHNIRPNQGFSTKIRFFSFQPPKLTKMLHRKTLQIFFFFSLFSLIKDHGCRHKPNQGFDQADLPFFPSSPFSLSSGPWMTSQAQPRFRPIRPIHKPTLTNQKTSAHFSPPPSLSPSRMSQTFPTNHNSSNNPKFDQQEKCGQFTFSLVTWGSGRPWMVPLFNQSDFSFKPTFWPIGWELNTKKMLPFFFFPFFFLFLFLNALAMALYYF